jgi:glycosyltransferase involved in cell wall biosynthesis
VISFIIPAHNEERLLAKTLNALDDAARSLALPFEIVVVDDSSTDRTGAIAREHGARVIQVWHRQIAAIRNAGAKEANGEMLVFIDADTVVTDAAVRAAVRAMLHGAVGGGCAFRFGGSLPLYGRILEAVAVPLYRAAGLASGCFLFCTREAFRATGGFDEGMFGAEEAAMSRSLRRQGKFVILRESVTTSGRKFRAYSGREILGTMARLAFTAGRSMRQREGLDIWYGERRPDPESDPEPGVFRERHPTRRCSCQGTAAFQSPPGCVRRH